MHFQKSDTFGDAYHLFWYQLKSNLHFYFGNFFQYSPPTTANTNPAKIKCSNPPNQRLSKITANIMKPTNVLINIAAPACGEKLGVPKRTQRTITTTQQTNS